MYEIVLGNHHVVVNLSNEHDHDHLHHQMAPLVVLRSNVIDNNLHPILNVPTLAGIA